MLQLQLSKIQLDQQICRPKQLNPTLNIDIDTFLIISNRLCQELKAISNRKFQSQKPRLRSFSSPRLQPIKDDIHRFRKNCQQLPLQFIKTLHLLASSAYKKLQNSEFFSQYISILHSMEGLHPNQIVGLDMLEHFQKVNLLRGSVHKNDQLGNYLLLLERMLQSLCKNAIILQEINKDIIEKEIVSDQLKSVYLNHIENGLEKRKLNQIIKQYLNQKKQSLQQLTQVCRICQKPIAVYKLQLHLRICQIKFNNFSKLKEQHKKFMLLFKQLNRIIISKRASLIRCSKLKPPQSFSQKLILVENQKNEQLIVSMLERLKSKMQKAKSRFYDAQNQYFQQIMDEISKIEKRKYQQNSVQQLKLVLQNRKNIHKNINLCDFRETNSKFRLTQDQFDMSPRALKDYSSKFQRKQSHNYSPIKASSFRKNTKKFSQFIEALPKSNLKHVGKLKSMPNLTQDNDLQNRIPMRKYQSLINLSKEVVRQSMDLSRFELIRKLGKGAYGSVFLVKRKSTNDYYAIKMIEIQRNIERNKIQQLRNQHDIFAKISGQFLVKAPFSFSVDHWHCFVMQYMSGGDLSQLLQQQVYLTQQAAKFYVAQIVLAIEYLHSLNIIHRDLKPQNLVMTSQGHLKLTDFGLSDLGIRKKADLKSFKNISLSEISQQLISSRNQRKNTKILSKFRVIGTPDYIAPQIISGKSSNKKTVDWWSLGVITYQLLIGTLPFSAQTIQQVFQNILKLRIQWPQIGNQQGMISQVAKDFIESLLTTDQQARLGHHGAAQVKAHRFFNDIQWSTIRNTKPPHQPKAVTSYTNLKDYTEIPLSTIQLFEKESVNKVSNQELNMSMMRVDLLKQQTIQQALLQPQMQNWKETLQTLQEFSNKLKSIQ